MSKDTFVVRGLAGKKALNGEVTINGAKNAVLKAMAAAILFDGPVTLQNVPHTEDTKRMNTLLTNLGATVIDDEKSQSGKTAKKQVTIDPTPIFSTDFDPEIAKSMRASVVATGPVLARYGRVAFSVPGGCVIGARPIDLFLKGYEKMGAKVEIINDEYVITAPGKKLKGADIFFNVQTVGGTETLMMAAVLAKGKTTLRNCAMEPEIVSLAEYLVKCGAKIRGIGTPTLEITGTGGKLLKSGGKIVTDKSGIKKVVVGKPYVTIPDRIETGSFLLLGAICADNLKIKNCNPEHLEILINMLRESGVEIHTGKNTIELRNNAKIKNADLKPINVRTHEYPGFPTDIQAPMVTYLTQVGGESTVFETIYEGRFKFTQNLEKLGASVTVMNPREILVKGAVVAGAGETKESMIELKAMEGEALDAFDIRAGFATVMAALVASGTSLISNVYFIDRGYESLETRLASLGADIRRVHGDEI